MAFAQGRLCDQGNVAPVGNDPGRGGRTLQVGMVDRRERVILQGRGNGAGLGLAARIEWDVGVSLQAALGIPGGFTVTDEAKSGSG